MYKLYFLILLFVSVSMLTNCHNTDYEITTNPIQLALNNPSRNDYDKSRDKQRKTETILAIASIKPGMSVADLDAGSGYYSELFSYLVGNTGKVYLQNAERFVTNKPHEIEKRLEGNRLPNVFRIDSSFNNLKIPQNLDLIFIGLAFHDVFAKQQNANWNADPDVYLRQLYNSLGNDGRLLLIDHSAVKGSGILATDTIHRIDEEFTIKTLESVGFKLILSSDILRNPSDDPNMLIWDEKVYKKTDRFVLLFSK